MTHRITQHGDRYMLEIFRGGVRHVNFFYTYRQASRAAVRRMK